MVSVAVNAEASPLPGAAVGRLSTGRDQRGPSRVILWNTTESVAGTYSTTKAASPL